MDVEDIQDIDAISIASSVSSSVSTTSQKVFSTLMSGRSLVHIIISEIGSLTLWLCRSLIPKEKAFAALRSRSRF